MLEHVFRPDIAIHNMTKMMKEGATIYHMVPLAGLVDHGFFSFSPTFFLDYYSKAGIQVDSIRMQYKPERGIYKFVYYSMDCRLFITPDDYNQYIQKYWNFGGEIQLQCIASRHGNPTLDYHSVPTQRRYEEIYGERK